MPEPSRRGQDRPTFASRKRHEGNLRQAGRARARHGGRGLLRRSARRSLPRIRTAVAFARLVLATLPAAARDGIVVWNDDGDLAVGFATMTPDNPAKATKLVTPVPLRSISVAMTADALGGTVAGIGHELQDGTKGGGEV